MKVNRDMAAATTIMHLLNDSKELKMVVAPDKEKGLYEAATNLYVRHDSLEKMFRARRIQSFQRFEDFIIKTNDY